MIYVDENITPVDGKTVFMIKKKNMKKISKNQIALKFRITIIFVII